MQHFRDVAFIEDALFPHDQVEHDGWIFEDAAGVFRAAFFVQFDPFELRPNTLLFRFPRDCLGANSEMDRRFEVDSCFS